MGSPPPPKKKCMDGHKGSGVARIFPVGGGGGAWAFVGGTNILSWQALTLKKVLIFSGGTSWQAKKNKA